MEYSPTLPIINWRGGARSERKDRLEIGELGPDDDAERRQRSEHEEDEDSAVESNENTIAKEYMKRRDERHWELFHGSKDLTAGSRSIRGAPYLEFGGMTLSKPPSNPGNRKAMTALQKEREDLIRRLADVERRQREELLFHQRDAKARQDIEEYKMKGHRKPIDNPSWQETHNAKMLIHMKKELEARQIEEGAVGSEAYEQYLRDEESFKQRVRHNSDNFFSNEKPPWEDADEDGAIEINRNQLDGKEPINLLDRMGVGNISADQLRDWENALAPLRKQYFQENINATKTTVKLLEKGFNLLDCPCRKCDTYLIGPRKIKNTTKLNEAYCPCCKGYTVVSEGIHAYPEIVKKYRKADEEAEEERLKSIKYRQEEFEDKEAMGRCNYESQKLQ
eukprot:jgi/Bigna1/130060/aug1.10_g4768